MALRELMKGINVSPLSKLNGILTAYVDVGNGINDTQTVLRLLKENFEEEREQKEPYNFFAATPDAPKMFPSIFGSRYEKINPKYYQNLPIFGELAFIQRTQEGINDPYIFGRNGVVNMYEFLEKFGLQFPDFSSYFKTVIREGDRAFRTVFSDGTRELAVYKPDVEFNRHKTGEALLYRYNIYESLFDD